MFLTGFKIVFVELEILSFIDQLDKDSKLPQKLLLLIHFCIKKVITLSGANSNMFYKKTYMLLRT